MPRSRKKQPITARQPETGTRFKRSRVETARLIRRFHVLNKELAKCKVDPGASQEQQDTIRAEMEAMGGLDWYQRASQLGQSKIRGGDSSKWLVQTLKDVCRANLEIADKPLRALDVGAVAPDNYAPHATWIHAKPIDLNPQHADIEKQDFLCMNPPTSTTMYDIVCLSLVLNFVGDPKDRGRMLIHTRDFLYPLHQTGHLHFVFLVLPLPCINNSRYMSHDHFLAMMESIGYSRCVHYHFSNKLAYYLFELTSRPDLAHIDWKKKIIPGQSGGKRNNFAIIM